MRTGDADHLKAVGARLMAGRFFAPDDDSRNAPVVVVNEAFVRRYFPAEAAVGQRITALFGPRQIVGVIGDMRYEGPADLPSPTMYFPMAQFALPEQTLIVRTSGDAASLIPALRRVIRDLDINIAPFDVAPVETALEVASGRERFSLALLTAFAALALMLAVIGIYGVVAYSVGRRKREIALRLALGASAVDVLGRIVAGMLVRACVGVGVGMAAASAMGSILRPLVFETSTQDAAIYAAVALVLLTAVLLGTVLPARWITGMNAAATLREQ